MRLTLLRLSSKRQALRSRLSNLTYRIAFKAGIRKGICFFRRVRRSTRVSDVPTELSVVSGEWQAAGCQQYTIIINDMK